MSGENVNGEAMLTPGVAASRLGISGAALRRMAAAYERVHGALPDSGAGRLWPVEAVERLEQARALLAAGRAKSIQAALEAHEAGAQVSVEAAAVSVRDSGVLDIIAARLEGVERLEQHIEGLQREVKALRGEVSKLRALPEPTEQTKRGEDDDRLTVRVMRWLERRLR